MSLLVIGLTAIGCNGGSSANPAGSSGAAGTTTAPPASGAGASTPISQVQAVIPTSGGKVQIPNTGGIDGTLTFGPGAPPNDQITLTASTAPLGTLVPAVKTDDHPNFFYVTFTVTQPTKYSLLSGVLLNGPLPKNAELMDTEVADITGTNQVIDNLQGERTVSGATYEPAFADYTFQPARTYALRFGSMDQKTLPVTITNNSGIKPAYVFIPGNPKPGDVTPCRVRQVSDTQYDLVPMKEADIGSDGFADYNIPIPDSGKLVINLPYVTSGRIYVMLGNKMKTLLNKGQTGPALYSVVNGWSNSADANFDTVFDWLEFNYRIGEDSQQTGMDVNTTALQMFSIPFDCALLSADGSKQTMGSKPGARKEIFDALASTKPFNELIIQGSANAKVKPLRAIALDQAMRNFITKAPGVPQFDDTTLFEKYIDAAWQHFKPVTLGGKGNKLTMFTSAFGSYTGVVNDKDQMVFTWNGDQGAEPPAKDPIVIARPTTIQAIIGNGPLADDPSYPTIGCCSTNPSNWLPGSTDCDFFKEGRFTNPQGTVCRQIGSTMSAALNRGILLIDTAQLPGSGGLPFAITGGRGADFCVNFICAGLCQPKIYYQDSLLPDGVTKTPLNLYSKLMHEHSQATQESPKGGVYGFGFDDNCNQSSNIADQKGPTGFTINIPPMP